jgi:integrase
MERFATQERLNAAADGRHSKTAAAIKGSIAWLISTYRDSDDYRALRPGTVKYYDRYLADIEALGPGDPFSEIDREMIVDFIETYPKPHQRKQLAVVLKNLVRVARYRGLIQVDPTTDLRLKSSPPRDRVWTDAEIVSWLEAAAGEDGHMTTGFLLLQYTAQRPGDVLAMTWAQYENGTLRLRQQKTGALLDVKCHPALKSHLDGLTRSSLMIVSYRGRPVKYLRFNERFRRIAQRAGIDAQARDLRRTAMLRMALAGATVPPIASVSGHSIDSTQRILETYLPRNAELGAAAITLLAEHKKTTKV